MQTPTNTHVPARHRRAESLAGTSIRLFMTTSIHDAAAAACCCDNDEDACDFCVCVHACMCVVIYSGKSHEMCSQRHQIPKACVYSTPGTQGRGWTGMGHPHAPSQKWGGWCETDRQETRCSTRARVHAQRGHRSHCAITESDEYVERCCRGASGAAAAGGCARLVGRT